MERVTPPAQHSALHRFLTDAAIRRNAEGVRDGNQSIAHALEPAIAVVIENHLDQPEMGPLIFAQYASEEQRTASTGIPCLPCVRTTPRSPARCVPLIVERYGVAGARRCVVATSTRIGSGTSSSFAQP